MFLEHNSGKTWSVFHGCDVRTLVCNTCVRNTRTCAPVFTRHDRQKCFSWARGRRSRPWKSANEEERARGNARKYKSVGHRGRESRGGRGGTKADENKRWAKRKRWIKETAVSGDVFLTTSSSSLPELSRRNEQRSYLINYQNQKCRRWRDQIPPRSRRLSA